MPAITTMIAAASLGAGLKANSDAKKAAKRQEALHAEQAAEVATINKEKSLLEAQDTAQSGADVVLGTRKASDKLLKENSTGKLGKGVKIGGLSASASNIGGL
jgi:hypothetical protein